MSLYDDAAGRGRTLLELDRPRDAEALLLRALASHPARADLQLLLGQALLAQDRYVDARTAIQQSLVTEPDSAFALLLLSGAEAGAGDRPAALTAAREALRLAPLSPPVHHQIGALLLNGEQPIQALRWLVKARELDPTDATAATSLAIVHLRLRRYGEARAQIEAALQLQPNDASAHFVSGLIETAEGGSRRGVRAHREALRLDPTNPVNRAGLVEALKIRNPAYRLMVRFTEWRQTLGETGRKMVTFAPMAAVVLLRPLEHTTVGLVLICALLFLVYLSWAADPMASLALCLGRNGRLLEPATRRSAIGFGVYFTAMLASIIWGVLSGPPEPFVVAALFAIWSICAGWAHHTPARFRPVRLAAHAIGAMLLLAMTYLAATGGAFNALVVLTAVAGFALGFAEAAPVMRGALAQDAA